MMLLAAVSIALLAAGVVRADSPAVRGTDVVLSTGYVFGYSGDGLIPVYELGAADAPTSTSHDFPSQLQIVMPVSHRLGAALSARGGMIRSEVEESALIARSTDWIGAGGVQGIAFWRDPERGILSLGYGFDWIGGRHASFDSHIHSAGMGFSFYREGATRPWDFNGFVGYSREIPRLDFLDLHSDELDVSISARSYASDRIALDLSIDLTQFLGEPNETSLITISGAVVWLPPLGLGRALTLRLAAGGGSFNLRSRRGAPVAFASLSVAVHYVDVTSLVELVRNY
jgi:hypothetical protein